MSNRITRAIKWSAVCALSLFPLSSSAAAGQTEPISPSSPFKVAVYDADPEHLWNRLYAALYVRTTDDGQSLGQDELDPLLWENSTYLLREPRYQQVLGLLNEFLERRGERLIAQPLKKAVFQHDLWAVFDWLADPAVEPRIADAGDKRRTLRNRLAPVIRSLALPAGQINQLPDNYGVAVALGAYPPRQDTAHAEKAFLPPDLFDAHGPWVHFQTGGGRPYPLEKPTALTHVYFVGGRSAFFVFMNLPAGRQSTRSFMQELNALPKPIAHRTSGTAGPNSTPGSRPSPPSGTKLALVRRMMLIDDRGEMRLTRLVESVQIRVVNPTTEGGNDFYEFTIHRKDLFDSNNGLRASRSDQLTIPLFNHTHDADIFDVPNRVRAIRAVAARRMREEPITENVRLDCVSCHKRQEINTATAFFHDRSPGLTASECAHEVERITRWKREKYQWGLLQGLTEDLPKK